MTVPRRRWFRFSLRTLFLVVTALACWLGYQLHWIRERHKFLDEVEHEQPQRLLTVLMASAFDEDPRLVPFAPKAPLSLRIFGESAVAQFHIQDIVTHDGRSYPWDDPKRLAKAARLFPEAEFFLFGIPLLLETTPAPHQH
jgi:hypothetical protein